MVGSADGVRLQAILDSAVDAIITIEDSGKILSANPATEKLFQYPADALIGENVSRLMPSPYQEEHDEYLARYLRTGEARIIGLGREVTGRRRDGSVFPIHLAISEFTYDGRRLFTGIVRDISDLKIVEARLAELNAELEQRVEERTLALRAAQAELLQRERLVTLGQVAGGIAHEIRNPLNTISTSAYYLTHATSATDEKRQQHIDRIARQVALIDSVVTALNDVAQLPPPNRQPLALAPLLHESIDEITLPTNVKLQWRLGDETPYVLADARQLAIVFRNLVRNARDAMPEGGTVTIGTQVTERADRLRITVEDTGIGMSKQVLDHILEPFYTTKARGIGLGLAICKAIVEKNDGALAFSSELGEGSVFSVELIAKETATEE